MRAKTEGAEILRSGKRLPRPTLGLGCSRRPCAGSRKHRRPRLSMVENRSRRPPTPTCVQRPRGPKSLGPAPACAVAPSLSATLPDRAPARASTADPVSRWSKIGRVACPRQYACKDRGGRNIEVWQTPAPSHTRSRLLLQTVRRLAQAPPIPFIDGRKSVVSRAHANMRATAGGAEILRSGKRLRRRAIALRHFPRPCAGSRKHRRPRLSMVENRSRRAPSPIRVQNPRGPKSRGPVNVCPVAPSLSDTSPYHAPARASTSDPVHRWSKIGRVARPHQYACKPRGGRNPKVRQTAFVCHWQLSLRFLHSSGYQGRYQPGTPGRTFPSASMPASGPRHARGPSPSPIRPSKRPLPIHSTRCATCTIVVTVASPVTTRVPRASCRTVPSAWADGPMPASGARHVRCPLPSPIRPSKRPLPIHSTPS
jgi:hypothetical protein